MSHENIDNWLERSRWVEDHHMAQEGQQQDVLDTLVDQNALTPLQQLHIEAVLHSVKVWREMTGGSDQEAVTLFNSWFYDYMLEQPRDWDEPR